MQIRLAENFRTVFYAPFYATIALGCYAREGLDITFVDSAAPGGGPMGLLDGSVDVTWGGPMRVMKARDEGGPDYVCFAEVVRRDPFYLVGKPRGGRPFDLSELPDLRFASVSEVPTPWLCLQHDLRERGIDPTCVPRIADRTMGDNLETLRRGDVDVVQMFEPYASMAIRQGVGEILHAASARGDTTYTTLLALRAGVDRHRVAFSAMVRATRAMQTWLHAHSGADLAAAVADYYPGVDRADLATALERYRLADLWAADTPMSRAGFSRLASSLRSGGFISTIPSYDDCIVDPLLG